MVLDKDSGCGLSSKAVKEIRILELSPSGDFVKIMNDKGTKHWMYYTDISPIEVLLNLESNTIQLGFNEASSYSLP